MPISLLVIIALFALMYFLLIRPQRRRQMEQRDLLAHLEEGDEVVTAGGLYGHVQEIEDESLLLEIAPGTVVRVAKRAIAGVLPEEDEEYEDEDDEEYEDEGEHAEAEQPSGEEASSGTTRR